MHAAADTPIIAQRATQRHVTRRIADSVYYAGGGIEQLEPIQIIAPSKRPGQNEKQYRQVLNGAICGLNRAAAGETEKAKVRILGRDGHNGQYRQNHETGLQQLIPRQAKHVEAQIHSKDRVRESVDATVVKAQPGVPLRIETGCEYGGDYSDDQRRAPRRDMANEEDGLQSDLRALRRIPCRRRLRIGPARAAFGSLPHIQPQEQKRKGERRAGQSHLDRKQCPENAGIVELPHP